MSEIKVVIVDNHPIVVEGLKKVLESQSDIKIIGCFNNGTETLSFLTKNAVDLLLLDRNVSDYSGMELCKAIRALQPNMALLMLTNCSEKGVILQTLEQGVNGYLLKSISVDSLICSVREALGGRLTFCREVTRILKEPSDSATVGISKLTKREKQILKMVSEGKTSNMIAQELNLSSLTVDTHRKNILNKCKAKNVAELTKMAMHQGMLL